MKIIVDDFIIFNDLSIHLKKLFFLLNAKSMALVWVQKKCIYGFLELFKDL
jgi:hypothetical protein